MSKAMVDTAHPQLSIRKQCELLGVNRNRLTPAKKKSWKPGPKHEEALELMKLNHAKDPTMGARQLRRVLERNGHVTSRWTVGEMMKHLGLKAIYCKPRTSVPEPGHPKYPYLLRGREIGLADEVWAIDICLASLALRAAFGWLSPFGRLLHSVAARACLPGSDHRLENPSCAGLASVQYDGGGILSGCAL